MNISDELLMAYADGQLDPATRDEVERAIAADPALQLIVDRHRSLRLRLNTAFDPVLDEPVPERLSKLTADSAAGVTDLARARAAKHERSAGFRKPTVWMSLAASAVLGIAIGFAVFGGGQETMIVADAGGLSATGALDRALSTQLASTTADTGVQIGVSYRSKSGQYCRSFAVNAGRYAGFACRDEIGWRVRMLTPSVSTQSGEFRTASSALPAVVSEAVSEDMAGEALDADGELKARENDWK
jgi:hypothetical protein